MRAQWVPAVRTPATPLEASRAYRAALKTIVGNHKPEAVAVLHAHGALETGRFAACWAFNTGNIKAGSEYEGLYCAIKLNEVLKRNGRRVVVWFDPSGELTAKNGTIVPGTESDVPPGHVQCRMRAYRTLADGVTAKVRFLTGTSYRGALDMALAGDPLGYVDRIHAAGYFTADLAPYERAVVSLFKTYLPLARTEAVEPTVLPPEDEEALCLDIAACMRVEIPEWLRRKVEEAQQLTTIQMLDDAAAEMRAARDDTVRKGDDPT